MKNRDRIQTLIAIGMELVLISKSLAEKMPTELEKGTAKAAIATQERRLRWLEKDSEEQLF